MNLFSYSYTTFPVYGIMFLMPLIFHRKIKHQASLLNRVMWLVFQIIFLSSALVM